MFVAQVTRSGAVGSVECPRQSLHRAGLQALCHNYRGRDFRTKHNRYRTIMGIATLKMSSARDNLVDAIVLAQTEAVILERYGRPAAVLISPERYDELMTAFENSIDAVAFDSAMQEEGANIPWEQVKSDLGLV